ncbi:MAG: dihydropteroate synthase [Actinobacteria bacterium]|nr:dihydropteroate synthase [Actinomycetota bacterium]
MFYPVFKSVDISRFSSLFGYDGFEKSHPYSTLSVMLLKKDELSACDALLENGFHLEVELEPKIDLTPYGFNERIFRCAVFLDAERISEIEGLADSYEQSPLKILASSVSNYFSRCEFSLLGKSFSPLNPLIMGIINLTPDSFYSRSRAISAKEALIKAEEMIEAGVDIIDVGGQSTRPGSDEVDLNEELERTIPVIKELTRIFKVPVSIDTYRVEVAEAAIEAGASIINDVFALRKPGMLEFAAKSNLPVVVMHLKGDSPKTMQENPHYVDTVSEISAFFNEIISRFKENGGKEENIILDPGIGFGKRYEDNLTILANLQAFKASGLPILLGHSRKSFIGQALDGLGPEDRLFGTIASGAIGVFMGASILRVHDVIEARHAAKIASEIRKFSVDA